jgi:hypothetical protein
VELLREEVRADKKGGSHGVWGPVFKNLMG